MSEYCVICGSDEHHGDEHHDVARVADPKFAPHSGTNHNPDVHCRLITDGEVVRIEPRP